MDLDELERRLLPDGPAPVAYYAEDGAVISVADVRALFVAAREAERCKRAYSVMNEDVCQTLGKVLGFPWFKDHQEHFPGATEEQGVAHDQVAETMAEIAAARITKLEAENAALRAALDEIASHDLVAITGGGRVVASKMRMRALDALQETKP